MVSAIQPTGQGGVDLGTWVEEEDEEMDYRETSPLFGDHDESHRRQSAPPLTTVFSNADSAHSQSQSQSPCESPLTYSQPGPRPHHSPPRVDSVTNTSELPQTPVFMDSPTIPDSPLSTTSANPNARRRRRTRYGTLVPDFAPAGAPTGFSIGLGAASPGFVLRPAGGSFSHGHGRGRSRSEDLNGVRAIMRGEPLRSEEGLGAEGQVEDNRGEAEVRGWEREHQEGGQSQTRRESWLSRLLGGKKGKIRLEEDQYRDRDRGHRDSEHDGDTGDGD